MGENADLTQRRGLEGACKLWLFTPNQGRLLAQPSCSRTGRIDPEKTFAGAVTRLVRPRPSRGRRCIE